MQKSALVMALVAGTLATSAMAQQKPVIERKSAGRFDLPVARALPVKFGTPTLNGQVAVRGATSDAVEVIYDTIPGPGEQVLFSSSQPNAMIGDEGSLTGGPGAGKRVLVTGLRFGLVVESTATGPKDYDIIVRVWDTVGATTLERELTPTGGIVLGFVDPVDPGSAVISADFVDLTTLPGGGIQLTDDTFAFTMQVVEAGTTIPAVDGTIPQLNFLPAIVGTSPDTFYRDVNDNGLVDLPTELRGFAGGPGNPCLELQGDTGTSPPPPPPACAANCDRSVDPVTGRPTLNVQDFTCFQNAFALGDLSRADVGGILGCSPDGALSISDFSCFQNLFAVGCP